MSKILVTGAGGFIASALVKNIVKNTDHSVRALIRNTNNQRLNTRLLQHVAGDIYSGRVEVINGDLLWDISGICEKVDYVIHAAAKTYVDHSIKDPWAFIENNIVGSYRLIEDARKHQVKKFLMVSTDETLGEILSGSHDENAPSRPRNPYAFSKASCESLAMAYAHTYGLNTVITRMENVYGPYQHPQKVFPVFTKMAMKDKPLPIYGKGDHVRQWLYLDDAINAFLLLLGSETAKGDVYHIAGNQELTNLDLAKRILKVLGKPESLISFIDDHNIRPGHDRRYALSCEKLKKLGWKPCVGLDEGIEMAVSWYKDNQWWCE